MKLPNGYGSVYKLSGKRRKPWTARKTIGWVTNEKTGRSAPVYQFIGYYATRAEAITSLAEYNADPYDLNARKITFGELYEKWSAEHYTSIDEKTVQIYKIAYNKVCSLLKDTPINDIRLTHLQGAMETSGVGKGSASRAKMIFKEVFDYAIKYEILDASRRDIPRYIDLSVVKPARTVDRSAFTSEEIALLWSNKDDYCTKIMLSLIYSGLRISELLALRKEDVHLDEEWIDIKESKTSAGIRVVPIARKIKPMLRDFLDNPTDMLMTTPKGAELKYLNFSSRYWSEAMSHYNMSHTIHDTRHTCITMLTEAGVDDRIIKQIVGHRGAGVTEQVYTHISLAKKLKAINLI